MSWCNTNFPGLEKAGDVYGLPENVLRGTDCCGKFYQQHPVMSRVVFFIPAVISGIVKVALFPIMSAVGTVALAVIAGMKYWKGEHKEAAANLQGAMFCLIGTAACAGFVLLAGFQLPLIASTAIFLTAVTFSLTVHIWKGCKEPVPALEEAPVPPPTPTRV